MPKLRIRKVIDGVTWWWCNYGEHLAPETDYRWTRISRVAIRATTPTHRLRSDCQPCRCVVESKRQSTDAARAKAKDYRETHRGKGLIYKREHYANHKPRYKAQWQEWYAKNKTANREYQKQWRRENVEYVRAARKTWALNHVEQERARKRILSANRRRAVGVFTAAGFAAKCLLWGWRCYLCRIPLTKNNIHAEHRIPISRGGTNWLANIAPSCSPCNLAKGNKKESEFRALRLVT